MGFALESLDPIGRWRDSYPKADKNSKVALPVDPSATLANGRKIRDLTEFKAMLLEREPQVVRCLAEKLLTYATGRLLEPGDRGEIDRLVTDLAPGGNRLRDLVHQIVRSEIFLGR